MVELGTRFGRVDEESTDVGLFDGGEGTESGKLLDSDFTLAGASEASGIEDFDGLVFVPYFDAVDISSGSLLRANDSLLLLAKSVEEA